MTNILYTEGSKQMRINSEILAGPGNIAISKNSIRAWDHPHENEVVDESKRDMIIDNICRAFRSKGEWVDIM